MKVTVIGCGDAFGSGGRFNTCFHVQGEKTCFLIDCGASSLVSLKARYKSLNDIQALLVTHFHADHCGGVPFFMIDARFASRRTRLLTIAGPRGMRDWYERAMENSFPGSSRSMQRFDLSLIELGPYETTDFGDFQVSAFQVEHGNPGGLAYAYRILVEGRTIAYTGDTAWTDALVEVGREADLFIAEAYYHDKRVPYHLDLATLVQHYGEIRPKRLLLTHMTDDMLSRAYFVGFPTAEDGIVIER
jgi:ribonuclease BN (tRNA processing enzyme)